MTAKQFRQRFGSKIWKEQWETAPQDEMPSERDFKFFYGVSWKRHYDWHQESDEEEDTEKQKSEATQRKKAKKKEEQAVQRQREHEERGGGDVVGARRLHRVHSPS